MVVFVNIKKGKTAVKNAAAGALARAAAYMKSVPRICARPLHGGQGANAEQLDIRRQPARLRRLLSAVISGQVFFVVIGENGGGGPEAPAALGPSRSCASTAPRKLAPDEMPTPSPSVCDSMRAMAMASPSSTCKTSSSSRSERISGTNSSEIP